MDIDAAASEAAFQRIRIIHIVMMVAVLVYVQIALQPSAALDDLDPILTGKTLWLLRGVLVALSVSAQVLVELFVVPNVRARSAADNDPFTVSATTSTLAILRMAFTEAIAIYGLLLFLIGGHTLDVLLFGAAALLLFGWRFPTRARWRRSLESLSPAHPRA